MDPFDGRQVDDVDPAQMVGNGNGYFYPPSRIAVAQLTLVEQDLADGDLVQASCSAAFSPVIRYTASKVKSTATRSGDC